MNKVIQTLLKGDLGPLLILTFLFLSSSLSCISTLARDGREFSQVPRLEFGEKKIPVTSLCHENNWLRTKDTSKLVFRPIIKEEQIDLGAGRVITKSEETPLKFTITEGMKRLGYRIPICSQSILPHHQSSDLRREATAQERLVLGALYQQGIEEVKNQSPSFERLEVINRRGGPQQSTIFFDLGGEGSGNGKVVANINIPLKTFSGLSLEPKPVFGFLRTKVPYEEYILGRASIPSSIIRVEKR